LAASVDVRFVLTSYATGPTKPAGGSRLSEPQRREKECGMLVHPNLGLRGFLVRSALITSVGLGILPHPVLAAAQSPPKVVRVGYLGVGGRTPDGAPPGPLREGLRDLGYVEGQTVGYEARFAEGKLERLPGRAASKS